MTPSRSNARAAFAQSSISSPISASAVRSMVAVAMIFSLSLCLQAGAVERRDLDLGEVDPLGAAKVDHHQLAAIRAGPFGERRAAAGLAELMADHVPAEGVDRDVVARGLEMKLLGREGGEHRAPAPADRAIALDRLGRLRIEAICNLAAMAASSRRHGLLLSSRAAPRPRSRPPGGPGRMPRHRPRRSRDYRPLYGRIAAAIGERSRP